MAYAFVCFFLALAFAPAQQQLKFEVASVRAVPVGDDVPVRTRGGPGTDQPELITYTNVTLARLVSLAYGVHFDQISGPSFIGKDAYAVAAKVPPGTTKEDVKLMWQDLLSDRFRLKVHTIKKNLPVYELSLAKGGPRFRVEPGFPEPRAGEKWAMTRVQPRTSRMTFRNTSMAEFIQRISWAFSTLTRENELSLGRFVDKTGLEGNYDFTLEFAGALGPGGASPEPLPDGQTYAASFLVDAIRQQLGLIITEGKAPFDVVVVDRVDRVPTEN